MSDANTEIILHNYPQSPVAEKARVALGIKGLAWRSVEIPRLPPKPLLTPMTGGYRRTPVMQIGADIYCDSHCILQELERRHPGSDRAPSLFPADDTGLMQILSRWTDGALFDLGVKIVLGSDPDKLDPAFAEDRGKLYLGPDWAVGLQQANAALPHLLAQLRAPLSWLESMLGDGRAFLTGARPAAIDAQFYHVLWFIGGRTEIGARFLQEFTNLAGWMARVAELGHGDPSPMAAEDALARAKACEPLSERIDDPNDPQGLKPGMTVTVTPDLDSGEQSVEGVVSGVAPDRISITRATPDLGAVGVHFPRAGFRVRVL
ncbi:MAG: glutathione S-transferase family protein [Alphaproteobacteria bacterium]|nr:glutathione S-transferase family protein [Alphaproteobacteria bacterium]